MQQLTWAQYKSIGRHVASYAAGGITAAVGLHFLSPAQGADVQNSVNQIMTGIENISDGVIGLLAVVTPIYTAWRAAHSASPQEQINTVAAMPEVKSIQTTPALAAATPSEKVVAAPIEPVPQQAKKA